jgi:S-formylglutathione hydrolase FrmB
MRNSLFRAHYAHQNQRHSPQDASAAPSKTLYLLHGRGQDALSWTRYSSLERYAEQYNVAVIMPEVTRSFYSICATAGSTSATLKRAADGLF